MARRGNPATEVVTVGDLPKIPNTADEIPGDAERGARLRQAGFSRFVPRETGVLR